jgi:hypothetical protein
VQHDKQRGLRAKLHSPKAGVASIKARARMISCLFILSVCSVYSAQARSEEKGPGSRQVAEGRVRERVRSWVRYCYVRVGGMMQQHDG